MKLLWPVAKCEVLSQILVTCLRPIRSLITSGSQLGSWVGSKQSKRNGNEFENSRRRKNHHTSGNTPQRTDARQRNDDHDAALVVDLGGYQYAGPDGWRAQNFIDSTGGGSPPDISFQVQSRTTLPEDPDSIASNPWVKSSTLNRCVITSRTFKPFSNMAIILYHVSKISRP